MNTRPEFTEITNTYFELIVITGRNDVASARFVPTTRKGEQRRPPRLRKRNLRLKSQTTRNVQHSQTF